MISFNATIEKFGKQGEKTGWMYIVVPSKVANKLNPGVKKSYRVKGKLDEHAIEKVSLIPMGEGDFITLENPNKFPLRLPYGSDDTTTNPNVKSAFGDGMYVYSENVWWAGGTR